MTAPDPIDAAIEAAAEACGAINTDDLEYDLAAVAIRAAAPILIAAGREQAAAAIEADEWIPAFNRPFVAATARGGTP